VEKEKIKNRMKNNSVEVRKKKGGKRERNRAISLTKIRNKRP
jgi:hypothetical protein